jgi:hypothetical protein
MEILLIIFAFCASYVSYYLIQLFLVAMFPNGFRKSIKKAFKDAFKNKDTGHQMSYDEAARYRNRK